jgi:hypothetical protein
MLRRFATEESVPMRKTMIATAAVLGLGVAGTGALIAQAQPAPPPAEAEAGPFGGHGPHAFGPRWPHHMHEARGPMPFGPGTFSLIYRQADRQLTPPDVQKIAEAFLLWNGNHSWKVVNVAAAPDGAIGFAMATQDGAVIARFTMDPHSGRVTRTG